MKLVKLELTNYKLLQNVDYEFNHGNVYIVQGGNERGKTTFLDSIQSLLEVKNNTSKPVTLGQQEGSITGMLKAANGEQYTIKLDFGVGKKDKFTLVCPDGEIKKKVSDIRDIFQYNSFTSEEFLLWSESAEGRKKQKNIVLELLTEEERKNYLDLSDREIVAYNDRTEAKKELEIAEGLVVASTPTKEDTATLKKEDSVTTLLEKLRIELDEASNASQMVQEINTNRKVTLDMIDDLEAELAYFGLPFEESSCHKDYIETKTEELLAKYEDINEEEIEKLEERIKQGEEMLTSITKIKGRTESLESLQKDLKVKLDKWTILDESISQLRIDKNRVIENSNLPVKDIVIEEDGVYLVTENGNLPFNDKQISTSRAMRTIAKIMLHVNKTTPILLLGRSESFDKASMDEMVKFADDNNAQIIFDRVIDEGELTIEGYETIVEDKKKPTEGKLF